ncbi:MAG: D-amino-acid transaminase [Candidatus Latescibacteria bacterium]|jgi:D-alanine transaminase|nr:D-amino-acid transaminase [Candidatus Latescibacterota bacterium]MBT4138280.1 D-amino-acid transaminase [Candidatus Latescibacterota bacterium]MBT5832147.1 D-amino-acid transaminase [Candidatus Latescibacterota bacterium]
MTVYLNGAYLPKEEAHISPDDRGFLLADGVYEVTRCYDGHLFAWDRHLTRLERSLKELQIQQPDVDFEAVSHALLKQNNMDTGDATIYLQITRGVAPRTHAFPKISVTPTVYALARTFDMNPADWTNGVKTITAPDMRWLRCDIKSVSLLPNVLAQQRAHEAGVEEAILIRDGVITEGSHTSFCGIKDGVLYTHPDSNLILPGITRAIVLELCDQLNIPVKLFPILESKLHTLDEMMILGTGSEVMPVIQIDNHQVGNGKPGPITMKLQKAYKDLITKTIAQ